MILDVDIDDPAILATGKLIFVTPTITVKLLQPSTDGGIACHPQDVAVVVADNQPHTKWSMVQNETH